RRPMRRWELKEKGEPGTSLELAEVDAPVAGPGQVVIDVEAVGLAFPDVLQCRGIYQVPTPPRFTPGGETAGRVASVGDGVSDVKVGDRAVFRGGGLAEQVVMPAAALFPLPDSVSSASAAALPINYGTTWYALHQRIQL